MRLRKPKQRSGSCKNERRRECVVHCHCNRPGIQARVCVLGRGCHHTASIADDDLSGEIVRCPQRGTGHASGRIAWKCMSAVRLRLKVRMLEAQVIATLLCECTMWGPSKAHPNRLRFAHHPLLFRCPGWRKRSRDDNTIYYRTSVGGVRHWPRLTRSPTSFGSHVQAQTIV